MIVCPETGTYCKFTGCTKQFNCNTRTQAAVKTEQASEDEYWNEIELLACEKRFIESNGPHCPEGFNIWHFITELKSKFEIRRKQQ